MEPPSFYLFISCYLFNSSHIPPGLNFIRLLRVVITPSVAERRKRLEAIGSISGYIPVCYKALFKPSYFSSTFSLQELRRPLQVRFQDKWSVQNQSWWFGRIWSVLRSENRWWRLDSVPEEARWLCGFFSSLERLQKGIRESERRVLAWTGQD